MAAVYSQFPSPPGPSKAYGPDLAVRLICPDCQDPHPNIREEFGSGDLVCGNCGLVLGDRIVDTRSEWRTFANDEGDDPSRVGAASDPLLEGVEQLDTSISFRDNGTGLAKELQRAAAKGSGAKAERTLVNAFREIGEMCEKIHLPKMIADVAKGWFKKAEQEKLLRGKSQEALVACCVFIACRQSGVPRTFKEVCQITNVPKKILGQCYKTLEFSFELHARQAQGASAQGEQFVEAASSNPRELLGRYINHLDLPVYMERACADLVLACRELGVGHGRSPVSIAGAAIYFISNLFGHPKSAKDVGVVAGVSDSTIKLVYRLMYHERVKLVKQEWIDKGRAVMTRLPPSHDPPTK